MVVVLPVVDPASDAVADRVKAAVGVAAVFQCDVEQGGASGEGLCERR